MLGSCWSWSGYARWYCKVSYRKVYVLWVMTPWLLVNSYRRFEGGYFLFSPRRVHIMKLEAARSKCRWLFTCWHVVISHITTAVSTTNTAAFCTMAGVYRVRLVSQFASMSRYKVIRSGRDSSFSTVKVRRSIPDVAEVFRIPYSLLAPMLKKE